MTLPVPVTFRLPGTAWLPRAPQAAGVPNADFLAIRAVDDDSGYHPILTIAGGPADGASVTIVADDSLATLRGQAIDVRLLARDHVGNDDAPGVKQVLGCLASVDGKTFELRQAQLVVAMIDVDDPAVRAVVVFTVTCTTDQAPYVFKEFEQFLASVGLDQQPV